MLTSRSSTTGIITDKVFNKFAVLGFFFRVRQIQNFLKLSLKLLGTRDRSAFSSVSICATFRPFGDDRGERDYGRGEVLGLKSY